MLFAFAKHSIYGCEPFDINDSPEGGSFSICFGQSCSKRVGNMYDELTKVDVIAFPLRVRCRQS